jgi:hypothetical protein
MKADVSWENRSKTVIRVTFSGDWDWTEFYKVFDRGESCLPGQTTCALVDLRPVTRIPSDAILHLRGAAQIADRVGGLVIVIATSIPAATMFHLFVSMYRSASNKFRLVTSDEEAHAILQMPID